MSIDFDLFVCDECWEMFSSEREITTDDGVFCSSECVEDFKQGLKEAGVIRDLNNGEEPDIVY